jgi:hypothetical protein
MTSDFTAAIVGVSLRPDTYPAPAHGWTCFHCGETFTTVGSARDHFGSTPSATPGCVIDQVALEEGGKPERGRGLLMALRKAELELDAYRQEDTELHRCMYRMQGEHSTALRREEEKGYARGLRDGQGPLAIIETRYPALVREVREEFATTEEKKLENPELYPRDVRPGVLQLGDAGNQPPAPGRTTHRAAPEGAG